MPSIDAGVERDLHLDAEDYRRIRSYVWGIIRDDAEADDLTQETFLRAHRDRGSLRDPSARWAWLYRIATNVCIDRGRQRARGAGEEPIAAAEDVLDTAPSLALLTERDEMSACVRDHLERLPEGYRAVLVLHDLQGLTGREVAQLMGISLATVKIRLHRGRGALRAALGAGCVLGHDERNVLVCASRS